MESVLAVDLGASSGRVLVVRLDDVRLLAEEVHRFPNEPIRAADGTLRWDWGSLVDAVRTGLDRVIDSREDVASIGIDTWGVDYGLLDDDGSLVAQPYAHRDDRTAGWRETIERLGEERVYSITGIQFMPINTLCQLAVHDPAELRRATRLLLMPELMAYELTGEVTGELTSASTTQLLDARERDWAEGLVRDVGVDPEILPPVRRAGTVVGEYRGVPVRLVGGHDTASAVAAVPMEDPERAAYLSSGTWSLLGVELDEPVLTEEARRANVTNEAGVYGTVRALRNVMGLWMLDELRREWGMDLEDALASAEAAPAGGPTVDATDQRFLNPPSMEREIRDAAPGLGEERGAVVRCVFESLAEAYARVLAQLEEVTGRRPNVLHVVGGGARNALLNGLTSERCSVPVLAGPAEATALGGALVQLIASGALGDLAEARGVVRESVDLRDDD